MKARILIRLKPEVVDAPGRALQQRLADMGYTEVRDVKVGRMIELDLDTGDEHGAGERMKRMCQELLANPVIEDFSLSFFDT
jgi:phosphoribosylformylglycinamidine synthase subunit PurS